MVRLGLAPRTETHVVFGEAKKARRKSGKPQSQFINNARTQKGKDVINMGRTVVPPFECVGFWRAFPDASVVQTTPMLPFPVLVRRNRPATHANGANVLRAVALVRDASIAAVPHSSAQ